MSWDQSCAECVTKHTDIDCDRHVLSGSYNNYFHIYDREAQNDIVLQADKSAFKAKKIGGNKQKPGQGKAAKNGKPIIDVDSIDFNKKILHGELVARHPPRCIA